MILYLYKRKKMVNYGNSIIYKLCCKDSNITDIYIGSTTNFSRRKAQHKYQSINENSKDYNIYKYQFIRDNGGFENWDMILIENYNCNSKKELDSKEREYVDKLKSTLNSRTSYLSIEDIEDNKEQKKSYNKKYNEENKTEILERKKKYREENRNKINQKQKEKVNCKFCGCLTSKQNTKRHQQSVKCLKFQCIED